MAEALKTEEYNLSQLHLYQEMEASRKNKSKRKVRHPLKSTGAILKLYFQKAKKVEGPSLKITSRTVEITTDDDKKTKETRNYVQFSDRASYENAFVFKNPVMPKRVRIIVLQIQITIF